MEEDQLTYAINGILVRLTLAEKKVKDIEANRKALFTLIKVDGDRLTELETRIKSVEDFTNRDQVML